MATTTFTNFTSSRGGVLWGMTTWQIIAVGAGILPTIVALSNGRWAAAGLALLIWGIAVVAVLVPIGGRPTARWIGAATMFAVGGLRGWLTFRSKARRGSVENIEQLDMPGCLSGVDIVDAPPQGPRQRRMAVVRHSAQRTWSITAQVDHPGIFMADDETCLRYANGLSELIETAARGELIDEVHLMVRANPDDCAEREVWLRQNIRDDAPVTSVATNIEQLRWGRAGVRCETFVTVVVPDSRLGKEARQMGGAMTGRMNAMMTVASEIGSLLTGAVGCTAVKWLTSPELAVVVRTGFAPGDRATIVQAQTEARTNDEVEAGVPWAFAGPSEGYSALRHYAHDAWATITSTIKLPSRGATLGALAPVLTPTDPAERRAMTVVFPITEQSRADRKTSSQGFSQGIVQGLKDRMGVRTGVKDVQEQSKVLAAETELVSGAALIHPYAVCSTTVPAAAPISDFGRGLDSSIRRAGFAPQRLDMAQDLAFVTANIPLGVGLKRGAW